MNLSRKKDPGKVALLGTLPPLRGVSSYCLELALALAEVLPVEFISFKKLYPAFAYPGGDLKEDDTFPRIEHPNLRVRRRLTWYNPLSWIKAGFFNPARLLHAQWWSLPLFPVYLAEVLPVEFISFKKLYPAFAYPGGGLKEDDTFPRIEHPNLRVRRRLTWYNPLSWIKAGFFNPARLLHAQWWSLPLFPVYLAVCGGFKLRGKPVVMTVHNTRSHERSFLYRKISGIVFKLGDHFIVHTADGRKQLTADYGIPAGKVSLIPHGPLNFQVKQKNDRKAVRAAFGFTPGSKVILLFGAIRPYKGIDTALRAFARVLQKLPESRLFIAGKPWERWETYSSLIRDLNVQDAVSTHLEYIPAGEVYKYFDAADIVVLPYHHFDSQSGVGASAVSFRKPLIVSRVGGLPDLVADRRFVVPPGDPTALAKVLVECLSEPGRLAEMAAGAEIVAQQLTWTAIVDKTRAVYRKILP